VLSYTDLPIDSSNLTDVPPEYHLTANAENAVDTQYTYAYPTAVCLTNAYNYIDETSTKDSTK
jgi:hypothetical protein